MVHGMHFSYVRVALVVCLAAAIGVAVFCAYKRFELQQYDRDAAALAPAELGKFADPSLKSVTVLFRHGDRAPAFDYKYYKGLTNIYEDDFPEGVGHLTKLGKRHMYRKGKFFRRLYNGFVSDLFLEREISIKTTKIWTRTFMSAAMVLAGMYPPRDYQKWSDLETVWQPIPISTDSPDQTSLYRSGKCAYTSWFIKNDYEHIINDDNQEQIEELLLYLSEKSAANITIDHVFRLYDIFISMKSNGVQLPEWIKPKHFQLMESIFMEQTKRIYEDKKSQHVISGGLLQQIGLNMEMQSNSLNSNTTTQIMHLYSGHDMSLGTMLYFLGNNNTRMPEFGASIHLHLHLDQTLGYIIKMFYYYRWNEENGEELPIPICGNPCKLEDFVKLLKDNLSAGLEKDCQLTEN